MIPLLHALLPAIARSRSYVTLAALTPPGEPHGYGATLARHGAAEALGRLVIAIHTVGPTEDAELNGRVHEVGWRADKLAALLDKGPVATAEVQALIDAMAELEAIVAKPAKAVRGVGEKTEGRTT